MCGNHTDAAHVHVPFGPIGRVQPRRLHRRAFLGYFGKGTAALAILGPVAAACGGPNSSDSGTTTTGGAEPNQAGEATDAAGNSTTTSTTAGNGASPEAGTWARANLGFVSAYVLARGSELAVVDTGTSGSADAIGQTIADLGFNYSDVKHVALTHAHGDHAGSIGAVLEAAGNATAYAGTADVGRIQAELTAVGDGDDIMGMRVIETPGHTAGHISLFDELTATLVAGDSMNGADGGVIGANPNFTADMVAANASIQKMSQLQFDTVYFGHGEPVVGGAAGAVADLAAQL